MSKMRFMICMLLLLPLTHVMSYGVEGFGNPTGKSPIPLEAQAVDVSNPDHIIGNGTPESCTAEAFIEAVAQGGMIVFDGGSEPFTITLDRPAKVFNNGKPDVVIDGGGLVTLSGGGATRILYMNTCDPDQIWTTNHCQDQATPRLTVQNITFANGNAKNETEHTGGGAIWARGGRLKIVNCRFINNVCAETGPDVGGGAVRVFDQYQDLPVYVVNSTFGGAEGFGNVGSNGGAISSIGVSWTIINCVFTHNEAIGMGGNPAQRGTVGGGSGGAIYNDGNDMTLSIAGSRIEYNKVNAYGSGIFFVTNNHAGNIVLSDTVVQNNTGGSWYPVIPEISMHADTKIEILSEASGNDAWATPHVLALVVNGKVHEVEAFNIEGYNYFKLRDLAALLNGTSHPFRVGWDTGTQTIELTTGVPYISTGTEGQLSGQTGQKQALRTEIRVLVNGQGVVLESYTIQDYTYFKLQDLGAVLDFDVRWDADTQRIILQTLDS